MQGSLAVCSAHVTLPPFAPLICGGFYQMALVPLVRPHERSGSHRAGIASHSTSSSRARNPTGTRTHRTDVIPLTTRGEEATRPGAAPIHPHIRLDGRGGTCANTAAGMLE